MTGTTTDDITGSTHNPPKKRTSRIKTPEDYVTAAQALLADPSFKSRLQKAQAQHFDTFQMRLPLEDVIGKKYHSKIEGIELLNPPDRNGGFRQMNFTDGTIVGEFVIRPDGSIALNTLYPEKKGF